MITGVCVCVCVYRLATLVMVTQASFNCFCFLNENEREGRKFKVIQKIYSKLISSIKHFLKISGHGLKEDESVCLAFTSVTFSWNKKRVGVNQDFTK